MAQWGKIFCFPRVIAHYDNFKSTLQIHMTPSSNVDTQKKLTSKEIN